MAKHKIKDPKAVACIFLATFFFCAIIVLIIMGSIFFSQEHPKVLNYANSMCRVDSRSYRIYRCQSRYYSYTCYGPIWDVHHGENRTIPAIVEIDRRYRSYSDAIHKADEYQIGSSYSCWYDTRKPSVAQWDKPSILVGAILLGCGGLSIFLTVIFFYLGIRLVKKEIQQNKQDNMNAYSYPDPYINH